MKNNSNDLVKQIVKLEKENAKLKSLIEKKHKAGNSEFWKRVWHSIWRNEELESENGKLEGKLADLQSEYVELENFHHNEVNELKVRLTKAKEIIRALLKHTYGQNLNTQNDFDLYLGRIKDAEQFLKDSEVDE